MFTSNYLLTISTILLFNCLAVVAHPETAFINLNPRALRARTSQCPVGSTSCGSTCAEVCCDAKQGLACKAGWYCTETGCCPDGALCQPGPSDSVTTVTLTGTSTPTQVVVTDYFNFTTTTTEPSPTFETSSIIGTGTGTGTGGGVTPTGPGGNTTVTFSATLSMPSPSGTDTPEPSDPDSAAVSLIASSGLVAVILGAAISTIFFGLV